MTFATEQDNETDGLAPKQLTGVYIHIFTLGSAYSTKASGAEQTAEVDNSN